MNSIEHCLQGYTRVPASSCLCSSICRVSWTCDRKTTCGKTTRTHTHLLDCMVLSIKKHSHLHIELVPTFWTQQVFFLLMQHDVCLQTCHSGEFLPTLWADGCPTHTVGGCVEAQVAFNIECGRALRTAVRLVLLMLLFVALKLVPLGKDLGANIALEWTLK